MILYFYKHAPPKIKLTNCSRNGSSEESVSCLDSIKPMLSMNSSTMNVHSTSNPKVKDEESSFLYKQLKTNDSEREDLDERDLNTQSLLSSNETSSKLVIFFCVGLLGVRIGISALFWDQSVHNYQDLFDSAPVSQLHQVIKN